MKNEDAILIGYDQSIKIVKEMMKKEEEYIKYYLSLFLDEDELPEKIDWEYSGKLKEIANIIKTHDYNIGENVIPTAFYGSDKNKYLIDNITNTEALRMIFSALKVYERYYGKDHVFLEYDNSTGNISPVYSGLSLDKLNEDEWKKYLDREINAYVDIMIEYIEDVKNDENVKQIKEMMDRIVPDGSKIYDNIVNGFVISRIDEIVSLLITGENIPVNRSLGYKIKELKIGDDGKPIIETESIVDRWIRMKLKKKDRLEYGMMYG